MLAFARALFLLFARSLVGRGVIALWPLFTVTAVMVGMLLWSWTGERYAVAQLPAAATDAPNVVLIVLDTVRASSLSVYGYQRATTPTLERLGSQGVVFDRWFASMPGPTKTMPASAQARAKSAFSERNP